MGVWQVECVNARGWIVMRTRGFVLCAAHARQTTSIARLPLPASAGRNKARHSKALPGKGRLLVGKVLGLWVDNPSEGAGESGLELGWSWAGGD